MKTFEAVLIVSCLFAVGECLQCYNCSGNSMEDPPSGCYGRYLNSKFIVECPSTAKYCVVQRTTGAVVNIVSTTQIRSCSRVEVVGCRILTSLNWRSCFTTCDTDRCNSGNFAAKITSHSALLLLCMSMYAILR